MLGIDRRTVQRYVKKYPEVLEGQKVDVSYLHLVIEKSKAADGRGFPLRRRRGSRLPLGDLKKKPPAIIRRTFEQRIAIIQREIAAMTDEEQQVLLLPTSWFSFFRGKNLHKAFSKFKDPSEGEA